MGFDFGGWLQGGLSIIAGQGPLRAQIQMARILDKPYPEPIVFLRNGVSLPGQTVRIEWTEALTDMESENGITVARRGYIMGFKDHPVYADLDVQDWDTFRIYNREYTVQSVNYHLIGQIQAQFEAV